MLYLKTIMQCTLSEQNKEAWDSVSGAIQDHCIIMEGGHWEGETRKAARLACKWRKDDQSFYRYSFHYGYVPCTLRIRESGGGVWGSSESTRSD